MNYSIHQIAEIVKGKLQYNNHQHTQIEQLLIDSRKIVNAETSLFFAITGERNNGHKYIKELLDAGVKNFVVSETVEEQYDANFILVNNSLNALQQLAAFHRKQFHIPVIGITGSNGKTIVKEWLYLLMREHYNIVRSPKSYNSQVGVPLSVWQMDTEHNMALFEAGISLPGEMEQLEKIIRPSVGIFTNIGASHDENFKGHEEKLDEKLKLFHHAKTLIYCCDDVLISNHVNALNEINSQLKLFSWSRKRLADLQILKTEKQQTETTIDVAYKQDHFSFRIPFVDDASIENAIHCCALMLHMRMSPQLITERMLLLSPVAMRLELKEGINHCSVINDSYNSDIGSLTVALDFISQQKQHKKRTVILSDILQSGRNEEQLYKEVAALLHKKNVNRLIGIGQALNRQQHCFEMEKMFFDTTDDFLSQLHTSQFENETVLLKGARAFGFERISKVLQQKAHETVLEINLNAIIHNLNFYRSQLKPATKIMAMVKAFAYGGGSFEIANALQFHRVDYLAVAYADEGVELRKAGIHLPIMVMNPEEQSFDTMIEFNLEPEIYSHRTLELFNESCKRKMIKAKQNSFAIHIKIDTGMHRLGFEEKDVETLITSLKKNQHLKIASLFSHLAGTDEMMHDDFTKLQIEKFTAMSYAVQSHFNYSIMRHILNSAGIVRFAEAQFEMVRLGIGLHGIGTTETEKKNLQQASTLKTTVSQIKNVSKGETIGYSRKGIAQGNITIATVAIGYADGLSRRLSNGAGKMFLHNQAAPIIGNVCMDMTMIDVTGIPCSEGDEVIVFSPLHGIENIAQQTGTIPYEVLTGISQRVKRVYFQE